jgi:hypothetical protein
VTRSHTMSFSFPPSFVFLPFPNTGNKTNEWKKKKSLTAVMLILNRCFDIFTCLLLNRYATLSFCFVKPM